MHREVEDVPGQGGVGPCNPINQVDLDGRIAIAIVGVVLVVAAIVIVANHSVQRRPAVTSRPRIAFNGATRSTWRRLFGIGSTGPVIAKRLPLTTARINYTNHGRKRMAEQAG
ncbi:hypothetical protein [Lentzea terrae]|uniref:hypothetical protein n=1 Tax=Lentzea terrae TaxID=2200761 RepID=UPI0013005CCE|nr:hypothetical protein [Lentzea terrae]